MICRDTSTHRLVVGWMGGWVDGWLVGQWVGSGQITKNLINLDLSEIIQFYLKIYDLLWHPYLWLGVWVIEWICGSMGGVRSNH